MAASSSSVPAITPGSKRFFDELVIAWNTGDCADAQTKRTALKLAMAYGSAMSRVREAGVKEPSWVKRLLPAAVRETFGERANCVPVLRHSSGRVVRLNPMPTVPEPDAMPKDMARFMISKAADEARATGAKVGDMIVEGYGHVVNFQLPVDDKIALEIWHTATVAFLTGLHGFDLLEGNDGVRWMAARMDKADITGTLWARGFPSLEAVVAFATCAVCGSRGKVHLCGKCLLRSYCGTKCQQQDWKERGHLQHCKEVRRAVKLVNDRAEVEEEAADAARLRLYGRNVRTRSLNLLVAEATKDDVDDARAEFAAAVDRAKAEVELMKLQEDGLTINRRPAGTSGLMVIHNLSDGLFIQP